MTINSYPEEVFTHQEIIDTTYLAPKTDIHSAIPFTNDIYLSWNSSNRACIKYYKSSVINFDPSNMDSSRLALIVDTNRTVQYLEPCTKFNIELDTIDITDKITSSKNLSLVTGPVHPEPINDIRVTQHPDTDDYSLIWSRPEIGGSCVNQYTIELETIKTNLMPNHREIKNINFFTINPSNTQLVLARLEPCLLYRVTIFTNEFYPNKTDVTMYRIPRVQPEPVLNLRNATFFPTNVTIAWDAPNTTNCINYYKVTFDGELQQVLRNETSAFVDDLLPCKIYTVIVCAVYIDGETEEEACAETEIFMAEVKPSEVINIRQIIIAERTLLIIWDPPIYGHLCIESYRTIVWIDNQNNSVTEDNPKIPQVELYMLEACIEHTIQIIPVTYDTKDGQLKTFNFDSPPKCKIFLFIVF